MERTDSIMGVLEDSSKGFGVVSNSGIQLPSP
jgi:hypothetical protein